MLISPRLCFDRLQRTEYRRERSEQSEENRSKRQTHQYASQQYMDSLLFTQATRLTDLLPLSMPPAAAFA